MGGVTNTLGYITAACAMGMLLKGTDWISWRIDERSPYHAKIELLGTMRQYAESRDAFSNAEAGLLGARHLLMLIAD